MDRICRKRNPRTVSGAGENAVSMTTCERGGFLLRRPGGQPRFETVGSGVGKVQFLPAGVVAALRAGFLRSLLRVPPACSYWLEFGP